MIQSIDYQIKQEPNKSQFNSQPPDKADILTDSKKSTKFVKANNYANAYDSSSPYSKGPKNNQSIDSILGIQA